MDRAVRAVMGGILAAMILLGPHGWSDDTGMPPDNSAPPTAAARQLLPEELAGIEMVIINSPPTPPPGFVRPLAPRRGAYKSATSRQLAVPTSTWTYGCTATSAGMIFGYYDRNGYPNMYTGPANGGVCPLTDLGQGDVPSRPVSGSCSIIATMNGFDGRTTPGHVNDYWISYDSAGPDPWERGGTEHTWGDCTADYLGTNQWKWDFSGDGIKDFNTDGGTAVFSDRTSAKLYDYIPPASAGLPQTEACHGMRLFAESRGYTVLENYTQQVDAVVAGGFSFANYKTEMDSGFPVMIQVDGHTMAGVGYDDSTSPGSVYLHDTWDNNVHSMVWGGSYSGMAMWAVTIIHLAATDTGAVRVALEPAAARDAGAQWRVDRGEWRIGGVVAAGLSPGSHAVSFKDIAGFETPADQTVSVTTNITTDATGTYTAQYGGLTVTLEPADARDTGAQWRVDGGEWLNSGAALDALPAVQHTVSFKGVPGYSAPADRGVIVVADTTTRVKGTYTPTTGALTVTLQPEEACGAGVQWRMDGGAWQDSAATLAKVTPGQRFITFKSASGWIAPASVTVAVTVGNTQTLQAGFAKARPIQDILLEGCDGADKNHDGLSYPEAVTLAPDLTRAQFDALDADHDGCLSREELGGAASGCACSGAKRLGDWRHRAGDLFLNGLGLVSLALLSRAPRKP